MPQQLRSPPPQHHQHQQLLQQVVVRAVVAAHISGFVFFLFVFSMQSFDIDLAPADDGIGCGICHCQGVLFYVVYLSLLVLALGAVVLVLWAVYAQSRLLAVLTLVCVVLQVVAQALAVDSDDDCSLARYLPITLTVHAVQALGLVWYQHRLRSVGPRIVLHATLPDPLVVPVKEDSVAVAAAVP